MLPRAEGDPRDENAFRPFTLRTSAEAAEAAGQSEVTAAVLMPITWACVFFFPSALPFVASAVLNTLGPNSAISNSAQLAFLCVY